MLRRMRRSSYRTLIAGCLIVTSGCLSQETKRCHSEMTSSQEIVAKTDGSSLESVQRSIQAVDVALAACLAAERESEVTQLEKARQDLQAHEKRLERRHGSKDTRKLTPEELEALLKTGDPDCPRGQAYRHQESGKEIRCTGALLIEMPKSEAKKAFERRGFKVSEGRSTKQLRAEFGAELFIFDYDGSATSRGPRCLTIFPRPGMSWQEAVARATGVRPDRLENKKSIATRRGEMALSVEDGENKVVAKIGMCN